MNRKRLLIVDDDATVRASLRLFLEERFHLVETESVPSANNALADQAFDAVILDIQMPGVDGLQALREWHPRFPNLPILILTGYADDAMVEQVLALGARGLMRKPFEFIALLTTLHEMTGLPTESIPARRSPSATVVRTAAPSRAPAP